MRVRQFEIPVIQNYFNHPCHEENNNCKQKVIFVKVN